MAYPALEVTCAESTTRVLEYDLMLHAARFLHAGNSYAYKSFDDMCHLTRIIKGRKEQHPRLALWLEQVSAVAVLHNTCSSTRLVLKQHRLQSVHPTHQHAMYAPCLV